MWLSPRPLTTCFIAEDVLSSFLSAGYLYLEEVLSDKDKPVVNNILKKFVVDDNFWKSLDIIPQTRSALSLLEEEDSSTGIVTFCKGLDDILGGGVALKQITGFCGVPGSGKTQLCMQLCVDVQIPTIFGGVEGKAVFIDTCRGVVLDRLADIAESCVTHCRMLAKHYGKQLPSQFNKDYMLNNIFYMHVIDHVELMAAVVQLRDILNVERIKLIVIDSLTFPFFIGDLKSLERTRLLYQIFDYLQSYVLAYNLAVVVTNQLTTKVMPDGSSEIIPAFGESLGHRLSCSLMLGPESDDNKSVVVLKSPIKLNSSASFMVAKSGTRDVTL